MHHAQLLAAAMQKQQAYHPLLAALGYYTEQRPRLLHKIRMVVHVFPWDPWDDRSLACGIPSERSRHPAETLSGSSRADSTYLCSSVSLSAQGALRGSSRTCQARPGIPESCPGYGAASIL